MLADALRSITGHNILAVYRGYVGFAWRLEYRDRYLYGLIADSIRTGAENKLQIEMRELVKAMRHNIVHTEEDITTYGLALTSRWRLIESSNCVVRLRRDGLMAVRNRFAYESPGLTATPESREPRVLYETLCCPLIIERIVALVRQSGIDAEYVSRLITETEMSMLGDQS